MISSLSAGSEYVTLSGGVPYVPYISPGAMSAGQIRYNPNTQEMEVYDGVGWARITSNASVDLSHRTKQILDWADKKMSQELELQYMMARYPGLRELHDKFEMMRILCYQTEQENNNV
jgi:hypothetical protein